jgi:anthranilate phosphoribosyltransferase
VRTTSVDPAALGLARAEPSALTGGDADANAAVAKRVLGGEPGAHRDVVVLNAAAGLVAAGAVDDLPAGIERAAASIDSGAAAAALDRLVVASQRSTT